MSYGTIDTSQYVQAVTSFQTWFCGCVFHTRTRFLWTTVRTASPQHAPPQRPKKKEEKVGTVKVKFETADFDNRWHISSRHQPQSAGETAVSKWPPSTWKAQDDIAISEAGTNNKEYARLHSGHSTNSEDMHACISSRTVECSTRLWGPQTFNKIRFVSTIRVSNLRLNLCPTDPHLLLLSWNHRLCT